MQQHLHVLVVDRERREALATWYGTRWLLPMLCCEERTRAELQTTQWLEGHGVSGDLVGQWLGRMTPDADSIDWLVVISASAQATRSTLRWTPMESLTSSASLLDYQPWAVARVTQESGQPSVPGPFGNLTWLDDVKQWVTDVAGRTPSGSITPYRVSPREVVLGIPTAQGCVYFKGLASDRAMEARITSGLSALAPRSFATTLALETRADGAFWWLADACPGTALAECFSAERAIRVAAACAEIQRMTIANGIVLELPALCLSTAAEWSIALLESSDLPAGEVATSCEAIERACRKVSDADAPLAWIPLDLDPVNVFVADDGPVRFIDLDDSFAGPAPLAIATFARRVSRLQAHRRRKASSSESLYRAYQRAWPAALGRCDWRSFEIAAVVLEARLGWERVVNNTARGDVHGVLDLARLRTAQRLARSSG